MRIHSLTLLAFLLLAAQALLVGSEKEVKNRRVSGATTDKTHTLGKSHIEEKSQPPKHLIKGKFVAQDQASCRWVVTEKEEGVVLKVECARQGEKFSCFFTGNPTSCLELTQKSIYWKQIVRNLRSQKVICGDSEGILMTKVCRKKFPESNLKLVNSTLIRKKPSQESMEPSPTEQSMVNEASITEPNKFKQFAPEEKVVVKDNALSGPAEDKTMAANNPTRVEDPDMVNQRKVALEYWSTFCEFFITLIQGISC